MPLVDVVAETAREIRARRLHRVALLGTRLTLETRMFGGLGDVDIVMPEPAEVEAIHAAYSGLVRRANAAAGERLEDTPPDFPHVDCAALHIDAVLRRVGLRGLAAG